MSVFSGDEMYDDEVTSGPVGYDPDDDGWQRFKDERAMGLVDADGNPTEPEPPDWAYEDGEG